MVGVIRVMLADDQHMVRSGLRLILETEPDLEVVAEAADGEEAVRLAARERPDLVLMDVQMPVMDGLEATARITELPPPTPKVVMLTTFERDDYVFHALRSGASGFLLKKRSPGGAGAGGAGGGGGRSPARPSVTRRIIEEFARRPTVSPEAPALQRLTERELEVLRLVAKGLTNAEIAEQLYVGEATVKTHVSNLLAKLGLRDRVQAVVFAYEHGIVQPGE